MERVGDGQLGGGREGEAFDRELEGGGMSRAEREKEKNGISSNKCWWGGTKS